MYHCWCQQQKCPLMWLCLPFQPRNQISVSRSRVSYASVPSCSLSVTLIIGSPGQETDGSTWTSDGFPPALFSCCIRRTCPLCFLLGFVFWSHLWSFHCFLFAFCLCAINFYWSKHVVLQSPSFCVRSLTRTTHLNLRFIWWCMCTYKTSQELNVRFLIGTTWPPHLHDGRLQIWIWVTLSRFTASQFVQWFLNLSGCMNKIFITKLRG